MCSEEETAGSGDITMTVFTYSQARQRFSLLLDRAREEGKVMVRRKDGSLFSICPEKETRSPLDVPGIDTKATTSDVIRAVRESRSRES